MDCKFEMDENGSFRFAVNGIWSDWVGYQRIATLTIGKAKYIAVSQYYDGVFSAETVMEVVSLKTECLPENLEHTDWNSRIG